MLSHKMIKEWASTGGLNPYCEDCVSVASVDLRWSGNISVARKSNESKINWVKLRKVNSDNNEYFKFSPKGLYMLDSLEYIKIPNNWCGILMLKSSMGRSGIHLLHGGFFDPGFEGTATFEISIAAPWPIYLQSGQKVIQLVLSKLDQEPEFTYKDVGHYFAQIGPTDAFIKVHNEPNED